MAESTDRGSGWSLQATAVPDGVRLELALADLGGAPVTAAIVLDRAEARAFARALLAPRARRRRRRGGTDLPEAGA